METLDAPLASAPVIPDGVGATLDRLAPLLPAAVAAGRAALGRQLATVGQSVWPEIAGTFSRLTNTGLPVEFAWSSREVALRYTVEVGPPEVADADRVNLVAQQLGWSGEALRQIDTWSVLQQGRDLRFGAWLGARHGTGGTTTKLYLDLPAGVVLPVADAHAWLHSRTLQWRMAGLNADGSLELYAQCPDLDRQRLLDLCASFLGSASPARALAPRVTLLCGGQDLPRPSGLSLLLGADRRPRALTWFCFAKAIFRDDRQIRQTLLAEADGESAEVYAALSGGRDDGRWRHGMVGVGVDASGATWWQTGLRPT